MLDVRPQDTTPPPPVPACVHREADAGRERQRLEALLQGVLVTRPSDDIVCAALAQRNLLVTARAPDA